MVALPPSLPLVMAGGALGAGARHLVGRASVVLLGAAYPFGTLFVNVAGGLAMGILAGLLARLTVGEAWGLFLGVGVLGGYTTFSSFSHDVVTLAERGQMLTALGYVLLSVIGAILALFAGLLVTRSFA